MAATAGLLLSAALRTTLFLAVALGAVAGPLRRRSAAVRHLLLLASLITSLLVPLGATLPRVPIGPATLPPSILATAPAMTAPRVATLVAAIWIAGLLASLARLVRSARFVRGLRRSSRPAGAALTTMTARLARDAGIRRRVQVRLGGTGVPVTWGVTRTVIVLPDAFEGWDGALQESVLRHELAHVARFDAAGRLLVEAARALYWFHPLVHLVARRVIAESERACDDGVLRAGVPGDVLGAGLLAIARQLRQAPRWLAVSSAAGFDTLEERIGALVAYHDRRNAGLPLRIAIAAASLFALAGTSAVAIQLPWEAYARAYAVPPRLASLVLSSAARERIDADVAFALVRVESGFQGGVSSSGGAVGLTQIMPKTARSVAPDITPAELLDPETNLTIGFRFLRSNLDRYGDLDTALAAYSLGRRELDRRRALSLPIATDYPSRVLAARRPL